MRSSRFDMERVSEHRSLKNDLSVEVLGKGIDEFKPLFATAGHEIHKVNLQVALKFVFADHFNLLRADFFYPSCQKSKQPLIKRQLSTAKLRHQISRNWCLFNIDSKPRKTEINCFGPQWNL